MTHTIRTHNKDKGEEIDILKLEQRISKIEKRNRKVELDKEWELSKTRRIIIGILTYLTITIFYYSIGTSNPFINSLVPTLGFILSTLSLPIFKQIWERMIKG